MARPKAPGSPLCPLKGGSSSVLWARHCRIQRSRIAEDGEILVRSPGGVQRVLQGEDATTPTIKDGWLLTGDVGEIDADGFLKITDRKKDIIVTAGGKNITPVY
ncbi:MAG: AMP-binding protein [Desulfotignum sp.]|nr:AMP-binding protein [Desulfotignum sp.]